MILVSWKRFLLRFGTHFCYVLPGPAICLETILLYSKKALLWDSFQLGDPLDLNTRLWTITCNTNVNRFSFSFTSKAFFDTEGLTVIAKQIPLCCTSPKSGFCRRKPLYNMLFGGGLRGRDRRFRNKSESQGKESLRILMKQDKSLIDEPHYSYASQLKEICWSTKSMWLAKAACS